MTEMSLFHGSVGYISKFKIMNVEKEVNISIYEINGSSFFSCLLLLVLISEDHFPKLFCFNENAVHLRNDSGNRHDTYII